MIGIVQKKKLVKFAKVARTRLKRNVILHNREFIRREFTFLSLLEKTKTSLEHYRFMSKSAYLSQKVHAIDPTRF